MVEGSRRPFFGLGAFIFYSIAIVCVHTTHQNYQRSSIVFFPLYFFFTAVVMAMEFYCPAVIKKNPLVVFCSTFRTRHFKGSQTTSSSLAKINIDNPLQQWHIDPQKTASLSRHCRYWQLFIRSESLVVYAILVPHWDGVSIMHQVMAKGLASPLFFLNSTTYIVD